MYRELQGCMSIYYVHACMIPICLGTSYQVHSYLFSFFMRESFSSCIDMSIIELLYKHSELFFEQNRPCFQAFQNSIIEVILGIIGQGLY